MRVSKRWNACPLFVPPFVPLVNNGALLSDGFGHWARLTNGFRKKWENLKAADVRARRSLQFLSIPFIDREYRGQSAPDFAE